MDFGVEFRGTANDATPDQGLLNKFMDNDPIEVQTKMDVAERHASSHRKGTGTRKGK
jgi:hypothetical protein